MADRLVSRSKTILDRLDQRFGKKATFKTISAGTPDVVTGQQSQIVASVPNIKVRSGELSTQQLAELSQAGVNQVEALFKMQSAYVSDVEPDDELELTDAGISYLILRARLDELGIDWLLFVRKKTSG